MKYLVLGTYKPHIKEIVTNAFYFLVFFFLLIPTSFATDVSTSFETTNISGSFTLGTSPKTVTFTNGEAKFAGIASLYHSGSQAFMVQNDTTTITFETAAASINVFLKAQSGAVGAEVNIYDINENLVDSYSATTSWQEIAIVSTVGITRMELVNMTSVYAVFDDFSFTAMTEAPPSEDPVKLTNPLTLPIFSGGLKLKLELLSQGLTAPLWGVAAPTITEYMYIIDQIGIIWSIELTTGNKVVVADLSSLLVDIGIPEFGGFDERGLLGIAFHPQFASNNKLYTYSSQPNETADFTTMPDGFTANHQGVLTEWQATIGGSAGIIFDVNSAREILRIDEPQFNHNGGAISFDTNDLLYVAIGDGGGADDMDGQIFIDQAMVGHGETGNGQNKDNILGTIIRIDPLGNNSANGRYGIPASNPFVDQVGLDEIFSYGLRNPYRLSFDQQTGILYAADVGQNDIEEVNIITSGANYGWNIREGSFGFFANGNEDGYVYQQLDSMNTVDPIIEYDHDEGVAIIGGFVYRGATYNEMQGNYVFGDYNGRLFYINNEGTMSEFQDADELNVGAVLGFAQDSQGELYVLANTNGVPSGTSGNVYKISLLPNNSPTADAGEDQTVNEATQVTLNASLSNDPDGDTINFEWLQSSGTSVSLNDNTSATPSFTAPSVNSTTTLTFKVAVNDGHLFTTSEVTITVNDVPAPQPPVSNTSSGCFIATAAFGSYLAPEVKVLREFRDQYLITNKVGRYLVNGYYRYSPPIAHYIADKAWLKHIIRGFLWPVIYGLKYPFIALFTLILMFSAILKYMKKQRIRKCTLLLPKNT